MCNDAYNPSGVARLAVDLTAETVNVYKQENWALFGLGTCKPDFIASHLSELLRMLGGGVVELVFTSVLQQELAVRVKQLIFDNHGIAVVTITNNAKDAFCVQCRRVYHRQYFKSACNRCEFCCREAPDGVDMTVIADEEMNGLGAYGIHVVGSTLNNKLQKYIVNLSACCPVGATTIREFLDGQEGFVVLD